MSVVIPANATDAFSHLFMVGLASILEDADSDRVCLFRWRDTLQAFELKTDDGLDIERMSEIVSEHAQRWSQSLPLTSETVDPHSNMAIVNRWKKTSFLQNLKDNGKHPFQTRSEKNDAKLNCRRRELFTQNKN